MAKKKSNKSSTLEVDSIKHGDGKTQSINFFSRP